MLDVGCPSNAFSSLLTVNLSFKETSSLLKTKAKIIELFHNLGSGNI